MKAYMFHNPVKYLFGKGATEKIGTHAAALGKKALLVTYPGKPFDQFAERIRNLLANAGVDGFGIGSNLVSAKVVCAGDFARITETAKKLVENLHNALI